MSYYTDLDKTLHDQFLGDTPLSNYLYQRLLSQSRSINYKSKNKNVFVASSSGGNAERYQIAMKNQLKHIGCNVFKKTIIVNSSKPIDENIAKKYINEFIKLL